MADPQGRLILITQLVDIQIETALAQISREIIHSVLRYLGDLGLPEPLRKVLS